MPKGTIEEGGVMERKDRIDGFGALALIGLGLAVLNKWIPLPGLRR